MSKQDKSTNKPHVSSVLDRLVPDVLLGGDIDELRRVRTLIGINVFFFVTATLSLTAFWGRPWDSPLWITPLAWMITSLLSMGLLHWRKKYRLPAMISSIGVCLVAIPVAYPLGGMFSRTVYWLAIMPMFGMLLLGRKWGAVCFGVIASQFVLMHLINTFGYPAPAPKVPSSGQITIVLVAFASSMLTIGWYFESARKKAMDSFEVSLKEQQALEIAKNAAELSNETKSNFMAIMSHELRTPLNAIIGYSDLLLEESIDAREDDVALPLEDYEGDIVKINDAGQVLLQLIDGILDLSKLESNDMKVDVTTVSVVDVFEEMRRLWAPRCAKRGNVLVIERAPELQSIETDPVKFKKCLNRLLDNACKFTTDGTITLAGVLDEEAPLHQVRIEIIDTGAGIPLSRQADIFDRFTQVDTSSTRRHDGSGLGLALTRDFIHLLGGQVTLESEVGVGSTFVIHLPRILIS